MNAPIPPAISPLLDEFTASLESQVPGLVQGLYLVGSLALGAFNERWSDIDFLAVLEHAATEDEISALREIHKAMAAGHSRWKLEGSYVQQADLGRADSDIAPYPCHHDNRFSRAARHDTTPLTWWLLKNRGIALLGPPPSELPFDVAWDSVLGWMRGNLHSYWGSYTKRPVRLAFLLTDEGVMWTVLGVLRQFYTFRENSITDKTAAGEYGLACLPREWHPLIREAIAIRETSPGSHHRSRVARAIRAAQFLRYVVRQCDVCG